MENKYMKKGYGEEEFEFESKVSTVVRKFGSKQNSSFQIMSSQSSRTCNKNYYVLSSSDLQNWIPKSMVSVDEKYLIQCFKLISSKTMADSSCSFSLNFSWSENENSTNWVSPFCLESCDSGTFAVSNSGRWAVGAIMESQSMKNILKSPLLHCSTFEDDLKKLNLSSDEFSSSSSQVFYHSPQKQSSMERKKINFDSSHLRKTSSSSSNFSFSDEELANSDISRRGIIQCVWKSGNPNFVFSFDDRKSVFTATMEKSNRFGGSDLDYVYMFYLGTQLVGKMRVSSSYSSSSEQFRILEREFVLFGVTESSIGEINIKNHHVMKNQGFLKKIPDVLSISHSIRKNKKSRYQESSTFSDYCLWEPTKTIFSESYVPSNYELAAVVVRDYFSCGKKSVGGWGLKFLKNVNSFESSDSCDSESQHCSTDVDVIVQAGYHGGPVNDGPSSIIERWKSGGTCDCGGWDLGCSLTILKGRSSSIELKRSGKIIELVAEGSTDAVPSLRVANVQEGLYLVEYQPKISALQVFSIVVASIHSQSSILRPKMYRS